MAGPNVENITVATFQKDVVERSMQTPILLDFWADWCDPCKTLAPVLEKLAAEYGGAFILGKVDTQVEQELAEAFGVQGIPFCVLVQQGRPADGFQGALPEREIVDFLAKNGIQPEAGGAGEEEVAVDPNSPEARFERARNAASEGKVDEVAEAVSGIPEEDANHSSAERMQEGMDWFGAELDKASGDAAGKLQEARQQFLARDYEGAMNSILASVEADRDFLNGLARRAMVLCFLVVGEEDERLDSFRRRLATLLY